MVIYDFVKYLALSLFHRNRKSKQFDWEYISLPDCPGVTRVCIRKNSTGGTWVDVKVFSPSAVEEIERIQNLS